MVSVDVVVVSYNSRGELRDCVEGLSYAEWVHVIVVDNDSSDESLASVGDLAVDAVSSGWNGGFAFGVNAGWRRGSAPYVLLLNPDARIDLWSLHSLVEALERDPNAAVAAPRIIEPTGELDYSQRRFPQLRSIFAEALFLHRLFPRATWVDEVIRDPCAYEKDGSPEWVSGACAVIRREVLEELGGLDEGFFMYGEDKDFCRRARDAGYDIRFVAAAGCAHIGGASTPSTTAAAMLARSRRRYAQKHQRRAALAQVGIALSHATHAIVARGGIRARTGHLRALLAMMRPIAPLPSRPASLALAGQATASGVDAAAERT